MTQASKTIAALRIQIADRKRKSIKSSRRKLAVVDNNDRKIIMARTNKGLYVAARKYEQGLQTLRAKECPPRKTREQAEEDLKAYALKRGWLRL